MLVVPTVVLVVDEGGGAAGAVVVAAGGAVVTTGRDRGCGLSGLTRWPNRNSHGSGSSMPPWKSARTRAPATIVSGGWANSKATQQTTTNDNAANARTNRITPSFPDGRATLKPLPSTEATTKDRQRAGRPKGFLSRSQDCLAADWLEPEAIPRGFGRLPSPVDEPWPAPRTASPRGSHRTTLRRLHERHFQPAAPPERQGSSPRRPPTAPRP